ncbi:hypothetical protein ACFQZX_06270 [Mucilaginibacter litoreus]|uniref:GLPGLI family protein n=1 Tax=Mucilaginibacter litoreus TaxID=1048221 RepID=A0ABW3AQV4_9SPHI
MKRIIATLLLCLLFINNVSAHYTQTCKIKYRLSNGYWSKYYRVDVKFMTGSELNIQLGGPTFSIFDKFACIFWADNKITIIKLSTTIIGELDHDSINNRLTKLEGVDEENRFWEICPSGTCF